MRMDLNARHDVLRRSGGRRDGFSGGSAGPYARTGFRAPDLVWVPREGSGRPISFGFGGGASVPVGSYKDALKTGWNGQGSIIFHFAGLPLSLRADLNYNHFTFKNDLPSSSGGTGGTATAPEDITQQILGGLANVSIPFHMGPVSPYITAGLAGFNIKTNLGNVVPGAQDES